MSIVQVKINGFGSDPRKWAEGCGQIICIRMGEQERVNALDFMESWFENAIEAGRQEERKVAMKRHELRDVWTNIAANCLEKAVTGPRRRFWLNRFREAMRYALSDNPPPKWPHGNPSRWLRDGVRV